MKFIKKMYENEFDLRYDELYHNVYEIRSYDDLGVEQYLEHKKKEIKRSIIYFYISMISLFFVFILCFYGIYCWVGFYVLVFF